MLKKILNKKEAMEYLNIGRARLDAEIKSGHIPFQNHWQTSYVPFMDS